MLLSSIYVFLSFTYSATGVLGSSVRPRYALNCTPSNSSAPAWFAENTYATSSLVRYQNHLYQCLQEHRSSSQWTPDQVPALWASPTPCGTSDWRGQTIYQLGSIVTYRGSVYTCIQAHTSQNDWTPDDTPALWQKQGNSEVQEAHEECRAYLENNGIVQRATILDHDASGKVALLEYESLASSGNSSAVSFGQLDVNLRLHIDNEEIYSMRQLIQNDGSIHVDLKWGAGFSGISQASLVIHPDQSVSGNVDGSSLSNFNMSDPLAILKLASGNDIPQIQDQFNYEDTIGRLSSKLDSTLKLCEDSSIENSHEQNSTMTLIKRQSSLDRTQDPGHFSFTQQSKSCYACKAGVTLATTGATVACAVTTCVFTLGFGCVACVGGGALAVAAGISTCEKTVCCPVACGDDWLLGSGHCCFGSETCLDGNGHCCSAGQQMCAGKACCGSGQSCIDTGVQRGTCCPDAAVCGNSCCPHDDDVCFDSNKCCPKEKACGSKCCGTLDLSPGGLNLDLSFCADRSRELCCLNGQVAKEGICCWPGESVSNGICCPQGQTNCGDGRCCNGTCENGTCKSAITNEQCRAMGYRSNCDNGCPTGGCRDGCCFDVK